MDGAGVTEKGGIPTPAAPRKRQSAPLRPIRLDFWSGATLAHEGRVLAQTPTPAPVAFRAFNLSRRLDENQAAILRSYIAFMDAVRDQAVVTPAAEWLVDNHHIVEENFRHLRRDLTPRFYGALPKVPVVANGAVIADGAAPATPPAGRAEVNIPQALALVWQYVAITNSEVSPATLSEMIGGFQEIRTLTIGEIWAIPALLRFVLLENLRRLTDRTDHARRRRAEANALADALLPGATTAGTLTEILDARRAAVEDDTFAAQLLYRLRAGNEIQGEALAWLDRQLARRGTDADEVVIAEHGRMSSGNVTTGNIVQSLRLVDDVDWLSWFETVSEVDRVLREGSDHGRVDKPTRNAYRDTIERIARRAEASEVEIARKALDLAAESAGGEVGIVLLGDGLPALERACGYRPGMARRLRRGYRRLGWAGIGLPLLLFTLLIGMVMIHAIPPETGALMTGILTLAALLPASEAAMGLVHLLGSKLAPAARLPGYEYDDGVPVESRTLVVIPCMLTGYDAIDEVLRNLEVHYLSNPRGEIYYALLSDWTDSTTETAEGDEARLEHARAGIEALALRYADNPAAAGRRFFLLHRRRLHNPQEGVWMGWERKRGKLAELNQLLRGEPDTTFMDTGPRPPEGIRYIVTLDADTRLPRDVVPQLVGKIAHPVNRPIIDPKTGLVTRGYGLMQPRVTPSLTTGAEASTFQRTFSAHRGLDPYVFAVSDLYQDLLGEGSFTGKGIYDIDAFEAAMAGRIPENTVLSHDLLEGELARAALVTDVQFVEDFPLQYEVDAMRQHRWIRGDWQLLPFILDLTNGLGGLARLKMADNLRRSLVPIAWVAGSVLGWLVLPAGAAIAWQVALVLTMMLVQVLNFNASLMPHQPGVALSRHLRVLATEAGEHLAETGLRLVFMAHLAALSVDAALRTGWRMLVSRRNLLEWRTQAQLQMAAGTGLARYWRLMAVSPAIAVAAVLLVALVNQQNLPLAALICTAWALAPVAAWRVSLPLETEDRLAIRPEDAAQLRLMARVTWRYFETFLGPETHHLPPDNYQDDPAPKLAERTSPTNIGLYLLSVLSARDFGWISFMAAAARIERTVETIEKMEKYRGHLYNWYDTRDLSVMSPRYISAVDSGNLAGHLLAVATALRAWAANPSVHLLGTLSGIGDVLGVVSKCLEAVPDDRRGLRPLRRRLEERVEGFARSLTTYLQEPQLAPVRALNLSVIAEDIRKLAGDLDGEAHSEATAELLWWANTLKGTCDAMTGDTLADRGATQAVSARLGDLAERVRKLAFEMDFAFLMDPEKRLLSIGFRPETGERDVSCYDLLASEARLASLFAIAKGDLPAEHWQRLGRPVTAFRASGALLSWSGSMFEYLMPPLVMHERQGSILNQSNAMAVALQMRHAQRLGLPWGVSESAFNARDREMNYQYYAFGVPALGLKRALARDMVVAPYASFLAAPIRPRAAVANLRRLAKLGAAGRYGFYDAVDFTPARLTEDASHAVVRNVMAHHHGMSIVAIANATLDMIHRNRFHEDPVIQAAELLLQEKSPREIVPITRSTTSDGTLPVAELAPPAQTMIHAPADAPRAVTVLSNGRQSLMLSATGGGPSRLGEMAITRWRPDPTVDQGGTFIFLRDVASGNWWSATATPRAAPGEVASTIFSDHKAEFVKTAHEIESRLEVIVACEANAEGRCLTLRNHGNETRMIEVTSYGEIVIDREDADVAHTAFSRMFVETRIDAQRALITARRNRRNAGDRQLHLAHLICDSAPLREGSAETDRRAFIGRGRSLADAAAFDAGTRLSGTDGFTLDPIFALRRRIRIPPGKEASVTFWTIVAESAEALEQAAAHYSRAETFRHESRLAWTLSQVQLQHLDISLEEAALFRRFAAFLAYPDTRFAARDGDYTLRPQSALWPVGVSGDHPIFVIRIDNEADLPIIRKALRMQEYFLGRGLVCDLVILNERATSYTQELQDGISGLCAALSRSQEPGRTHVFPLRRDQMAAETWETLLAAARIVIHARNGRLADQLRRLDAAGARRTSVRPGGRTALAGHILAAERSTRAPAVPEAESAGLARRSADARRAQDAGAASEAADIAAQPAPAGSVAAAKVGAMALAAPGAAGTVASAAGALRRFGAAKPAPPLAPLPPRAFPAEDLRFWNGFGGFSGDGHEYVVRLRHGERTPHPWINVIARDGFGFHVSAGGSGFTWAVNSRDYQISPWSNDTLLNTPGEAIHVRDMATGRLATPFAALSDDPRAIHEARHGLGTSRFRAWSDWIELDAVQTLARSGPAKLTRLTLRNTTDRPLRLGVSGYVELVLGNNRGRSAPMLQAGFDEGLNAVLARNPYAIEFTGRTTALAADLPVTGHLVSRRAFLGRGGSLACPAALTGDWPADPAAAEAGRGPGQGGSNTGGDPCAAILTELILAPGESTTVTIALADAPDAEIRAVLAAALDEDGRAAAEAARADWEGLLGALQVTTPDPKLDLMVNTWLPYQNLACRIRARTAFYQASGAFGFRDQLQDTSAMILYEPALARAQILNAAGRQFAEGDVQHWWLPGNGAGVRTMISDDVVWLGHITARYVTMTGDTGILDEELPFLEGPELEEGQHDAFFIPGRSAEVASLYAHCALALDLAIQRTGPHGLPLILGGDWNDGMNRVGEGGRGESVWLGWFLGATLDAFASIAAARGDTARVERWAAHYAALAAALEEAGWDGGWYRRGYFDDGTPLGSTESEECRIDNIAQSWSSISGIAPRERADAAMDAALAHLEDREAGLLKLFKPPFSKTTHEPGYIKSYPPGVRENGGQYTHAATWMVYALGRAGRGTDAHRLFDVLNPVSHALDREAALRYRVEPYVVAADVYGVGEKTGRGGWTWYTGSAGWLQRAAVEGILGILPEGGTRLRVTPALPADWPGYSAVIRLRGRPRRLEVRREDAGFAITLDGKAPGADGIFELGDA